MEVTTNTLTWFVEEKQGACTTNRRPTAEEIEAAAATRDELNALNQQIQALSKRRAELLRSCPHTVSQDTPGFLYDARSCVACGKSQGFI